MISRRRVVAAGASSQSGSGWGAPGVGGGGGGGGIPAVGPGSNAPTWAGKTFYTAETFAAPIPVHPSTGTNGIQGYQGFDGYGGITYPQQRVTYPTVETPFGSQKIMRILYPGSRTNLSAVDAVTPSYTYFGSEYTNASVTVRGTWSGTLAFEQSTDGGSSWSAVSLTGLSGAPTGSTSTVNGNWAANTGNNTPVLLRVRASSWTSGTAQVDLGFRGGQAPARFLTFRASGSPTKLYQRYVLRTSANWSDNGNSGTKLMFWSQLEGNNHGIRITEGGDIWPVIFLQNAFNDIIEPTYVEIPHADWYDLEFIAEANTVGNADGRLAVFMNGAQVYNNTAIEFFASNPRFTNTLCDPTYGGGGNPPPADLTVDLAMIYTETA